MGPAARLITRSGRRVSAGFSRRRVSADGAFRQTAGFGRRRASADGAWRFALLAVIGRGHSWVGTRRVDAAPVYSRNFVKSAAEVAELSRQGKRSWIDEHTRTCSSIQDLFIVMPHIARQAKYPAGGVARGGQGREGPSRARARGGDGARGQGREGGKGARGPRHEGARSARARGGDGTRGRGGRGRGGREGGDYGRRGRERRRDGWRGGTWGDAGDVRDLDRHVSGEPAGRFLLLSGWVWGSFGRVSGAGARVSGRTWLVRSGVA